MARIERLEVLGVEPDFFHLPRTVSGLDSVEYFLISPVDDIATNVRHWDWWDILGIGRVVHHPHELELRQIHIEEEALQWPNFNAWTDATGPYSVHPAELHALQTFLLALAAQIPRLHITGEPHTYFLQASAADYAACGIPQGLLDRFAIFFHDTHLYRYRPDRTLMPSEPCCFLKLSQWTQPTHRLWSHMLVAFETYTPQRIAAMQAAWASYLQQSAINPTLDVNMIQGDYVVRLSYGALVALSNLLEEQVEGFGASGTQ